MQNYLRLSLLQLFTIRQLLADNITIIICFCHRQINHLSSRENEDIVAFGEHRPITVFFFLLVGWHDICFWQLAVLSLHRVRDKHTNIYDLKDRPVVKKGC